jgi:glycosidase
MMHMAFTLSVRGTPQLYYGEEIAMEGQEDPDNRRDFPGGFPGDARSVFEPQDRTPTQQRMYDWTRAWIHLRKEHSAVRHGRLIDLYYDDNSYAFARQDHSETVIIAINRTTQEKRMTVPSGSIGLRDGAELAPLIGITPSTRLANGQATVTVPARTAVAYEAR